ncbi:hypothetical protein [Nostoc sp. PCC 9305]|uniref:hypothetical protein n=1 Tax=Nostoc sp. PCC 9305 TaxID=296636 RepID=UPI0039C5D37C
MENSEIFLGFSKEDMRANNQLHVWKGISQIMMPVDLFLYNKLRQKLKSQRLRNINDSPKQLNQIFVSQNSR